MTRGTIYLVAKNKIISTQEFNGDMYGSPKDSKKLQKNGHYHETITRLKRTKTLKNFKKEFTEFNKKHFGYPYFGFTKDDIADYQDINEINAINFNKNYFKRFFSDYTYWKNINKNPLKFIDTNKKVIILESGQIATFNFGEFIEKI